MHIKLIEDCHIAQDASTGEYVSLKKDAVGLLLNENIPLYPSQVLAKFEGRKIKVWKDAVSYTNPESSIIAWSLDNLYPTVIPINSIFDIDSANSLSELITFNMDSVIFFNGNKYRAKYLN